LKPEIAASLVALNHTFYEQFATQFSRSRQRPWPGFERLAAALPQPCDRLLDIGCGDGRLGRYLLGLNSISTYVGVDFSAGLLKEHTPQAPMRFVNRDISLAGCLDGLGLFEGVACVATLQHIPGFDNRIRLLREMADHLQPAGRILLANWQFMHNERQRRKVLPWSDVGLGHSDVEDGDYLLSWERGGFGRRYVAMLDESVLAKMADSAELTILDQFYSDGREGNLNLYTILAASDAS
jgi:SAM-dependent methyltransferase